MSVPLKLCLCHGCLCGDRKMSPVEEFCDKQTFLQNFTESLDPATDVDQIVFCWECKAKIRKFIIFKGQVKESSLKLHQAVDKDSNPSKICKHPYIRSHTIYNISVTFNTEGNTNTEVKKEKSNSSPLDVKEERDSDHFEEELELIDLKRKKKKKKRKLLELSTDTKLDVTYKRIELDADEIAKEREIMLLHEDYVNAMFKCDKCLATFPNKDDFNDHIAMKHKVKSQFRCDICDCAYISESSYSYHLNRHKVRYQCVVCGDNFISTRAVAKHYNLTHIHGPILEVGLEKINKTKEDETESITDDVSGMKTEFSCEFCDKSFRWKASLRKHLEMHRIETGQKRKPYCEPCELSFSTTSNLQKHVKLSSKHQLQLKLRKLKESNPEEEIKEKERIKQIEKSLRVDREQYPCSQCDKKFQWRGNLLRHLHSHQHRTQRDLVCEPCNRTFSSLATYKQHMKISKRHVSEEDFEYMCSDCGSRFPNKIRLKDHINWEHLKTYEHSCEVCQKVFKSHTSLYLHRQVVHKKSGSEHLCDHCGKSFPNRTKLRSHTIALHSGQSPYKCTLCSAKFSWHSCLSRHMRKVH